jgi:hypothetical protein
MKLAKLDENIDTFNGSYVLGFNSGLLFHMLFQRSFAYGNQQNLLHPETQLGPSSSYMFYKFILKVTLSLGPSLTLSPLFHPQFSCSRKMRFFVMFANNSTSFGPPLITHIEM